MRSRRQFIRLALLASVAPAAAAARPRVDPAQPGPVFLPMAMFTNPPPADDAPLLGSASGAAEQAVEWLAPRAAAIAPPAGYTLGDVATIVAAYQRHGESVGLDWFLALAQMAHETGSLTSFWSLRPQRNPAGLGVTGAWQNDPPADTSGWAYNTQRGRWEAGISFQDWENYAIPAHLGRLLAYALRDDEADDLQRAMIAYALGYRPLPASFRGIAPTITGLNGRWAYPGTDYGQRIMALARRMRGEM